MRVRNMGYGRYRIYDYSTLEVISQAFKKIYKEHTEKCEKNYLITDEVNENVAPKTKKLYKIMARNQ